MRLLVIGETGQLARELAARAGPKLQIETVGRGRADLSDPAACAAVVAGARAHAVINAAAWTAVDRAEAAEAEAHVVNAQAPGAMSEVAARRGLPFLQVSTDYVLDGAGTAPHRVDAVPAPLSAYGRTKLAGEVAVAAAGGAHVILRTSWVFSAHGTNFVRTMLRLGRERAEIGVVADQIGGPTPAAALAGALVTMAQALCDGAPGGVQHFAGSPFVSWADFARAIMAGADLPCQVKDIPTSAYPTPARRPANSRLDCEGLAAFGLSAPDWQAGLAEVLAALET